MAEYDTVNCTTDCLKLGAVEDFRQAVSSTITGGTVCVRVLVLAWLLLGEGLQSVLGQVLAAGAERVVETGREASDIRGDVRNDLWRRLVIVTDLEKKVITVCKDYM